MNRPSATETERGCASETDRRKSAKNMENIENMKKWFFTIQKMPHTMKGHKILNVKQTHGTKEELSQNMNPVKDEN